MGCLKLTYHDQGRALEVNPFFLDRGLGKKRCAEKNCVSAYRYGFQGQEKDDEWKGEGNSINYKYRVHDPRIGRFLSIDPLTSSYPHYSPYSFSGNKVIAHVELEGLEEIYYDLVFDKNGEAVLNKVDEEDTWYLPDVHHVIVPDLNISYTFSMWAPRGNHYDEFEEFQKDPLGAMISGRFTTNEQIMAEAVQELTLAILMSRAVMAGKPNNAKRLPQDVRLGTNKRAPAALAPRGRKIGKNTNQNTAVKTRVDQLIEQGATDIRVDQQQVNIDGVHVGINRPDLQYTLNGKRFYVEWDTKSSGRGAGHEARIIINDPTATVELIEMD
jgi:RHS repeat-associated protein